MGMLSWDDPATVVDGCIQAQRRILTGYKAQVKEGKVKAEKYEEALNPRHAAISLAGEPTLYPYLNGLVYEFHKRGFTTFIVTNGTAPEILCKLENEPSQLYVSLCAPDEKTFLDVCRPQMANAWKKINETLASLASFSCPTVIRLTLLKNLTLKNPERYAALITKALPTYVEPKGAMFVGYARRRINFEDMPTHEDIRSFSLKLAEEVGYNVIDESVESRVLLLSRLEKPIRLVNQ
jgi:tRNA wybutosine-synthesizing protein 1